MRHIVRFAMATHRIFCEPEKGTVAHTAASRLLLESQQEWDMAGLTWDEDWPAFAQVSRPLLTEWMALIACGF